MTMLVQCRSPPRIRVGVLDRVPFSARVEMQIAEHTSFQCFPAGWLYFFALHFVRGLLLLDGSHPIVTMLTFCYRTQRRSDRVAPYFLGPRRPRLLVLHG
jgi:hypothetical protein